MDGSISKETKPKFVRVAVTAGLLTGALVVGGGMTRLLDGHVPPVEERWVGNNLTPIVQANFARLVDYEIDRSKIDRSKIDRNKIDLTKVDLTKIDLAKIDLIKMDLIKKEQTSSDTPDPHKPSVAIYSTASSKPPPAPVTLKDLSSNGQARAIDFIARNPQKADESWHQLSKTLTGAGGDIERKDPYRADRVMIATVSRGLASLPGDRLLWTRIFVEPINFQFAGYSVATTDNRLLKLASIETSRDSKLSLDGGLDALLPGLPKPAQSIEEGHKTSAELNQQYENLGIDIRPNFLRIIRESAPGGDVVGNASIELSIVTDPISIHNRPDQPAEPRPENLVLFVANAHLTDGVNYLPPEKSKITVLPQSVLPHCPLKAKVWMLYEMRKIEEGRAHIIEGLQRVSLQRDGELVHTVEIVPADDIAPAVWSIRELDGNGKVREFDKDGKTVDSRVKARTKDGNLRPLVFSDFVTASELTHWLKANQTPKGTTLGELRFEPNAAKPSLIPYKNTTDECSKDGSEPVAGKPGGTSQM